jgi:hypothetical protein
MMMPSSNRTGYRHITLLGNILVRLSGKVSLAAGHQRCPPHLTVHFEVQT